MVSQRFCYTLFFPLQKKKHWESTTGLKQSKGLIIGSSEKKEGFIEAKQRPVKMAGRTIYRTLSPKRTPFQTGIDG
jgi:hypothetical protein